MKIETFYFNNDLLAAKFLGRCLKIGFCIISSSEKHVTIKYNNKGVLKIITNYFNNISKS